MKTFPREDLKQEILREVISAAEADRELSMRRLRSILQQRFSVLRISIFFIRFYSKVRESAHRFFECFAGECYFF